MGDATYLIYVSAVKTEKLGVPKSIKLIHIVLKASLCRICADIVALLFLLPMDSGFTIVSMVGVWLFGNDLFFARKLVGEEQN